MRVPGVRHLPVSFHLVSALGLLFLLQESLLGQASYQAQIRGIVSDAAGAVLPNATVTITEVGTLQNREKVGIQTYITNRRWKQCKNSSWQTLPGYAGE